MLYWASLNPLLIDWAMFSAYVTQYDLMEIDTERLMKLQEKSASTRNINR
jgi:hypothetical protein